MSSVYYTCVDYVTAAKVNTNYAQNPALMATKTSILIFYLRLARNTKPFMRVGSYVTLAVVDIAGIVLTFLNIFQCNPVGAVFSQNDDPNAKCIPLVTLYLVSAPVNIITDLAVLVLPIPVLTRMRLPSKQKKILVGTFMLGIFVAVVDVVRIYYLQQASFQFESSYLPTSNTRLGDSSNFAWTASLSLMWSAVEVNVGIVCACVPTLRPLVNRLLPRWIDHSKGSLSRTQIDHTIDEQDVDFHPPRRLASDPPSESSDHQGLASESSGGNQEPQMGMMDFLTTPAVQGNLNRTNTVETATTSHETVYFGFVNMRRPKSMMKTRGRESWKYCLAVTILFFLWGFSYGLLNTLNNQIGVIIGSNEAQTIGLQSAYFGAYAIGPLFPGRQILKRAGFKAAFITGLCIYGIGIICFWPACVLASYAGFVVAQCMIGFGLSILEVAANPFLALCGAPRYMEVRLCLAQGVQAVASIVSPLLAQKALFTTVEGRNSLIDVQWTYLAIALFCVILALFFYYMPLPEASDGDLHLQTLHETPFSFTPQNSLSVETPRCKRYLGGVRVIYITLAIGAVTQYFYVAAQECLSQYFDQLLDSAQNFNIAASPTSLSSLNNLLVDHTTFALGRFAAAGLCLLIKPRYVLLAAISGMLFFSILVFALSDISGNALATLVFLESFFEGPLWPLIFAITLRGMGRRTKDAAAFLTAGASGGAAFPWVMYALRKVDSKGVQYTYCVVPALLAACIIYPLYLNFYPQARQQVDTKEPEDWSHDNADTTHKESSPTASMRGISHRLNVIFAKIRPGSSDRASAASDVAMVEHAENADGNEEAVKDGAAETL